MTRVTESTINLFVYGTLMPGQANYPHIQDLVGSHERGVIEGILIDLGPFPALIHGPGYAEGYLLRVHPDTLRITDRIECCNGNPARSLYLREEVQVALDGDRVERAWTYFYAQPNSLRNRPRLALRRIGNMRLHVWPGKGN